VAEVIAAILASPAPHVGKVWIDQPEVAGPIEEWRDQELRPRGLPECTHRMHAAHPETCFRMGK
jgi:hypothetical protein